MKVKTPSWVGVGLTPGPAGSLHSRRDFCASVKSRHWQLEDPEGLRPGGRLQPHNLIRTHHTDISTESLALLPFYREESGSSERFGNPSRVTQPGNSGARAQDQDQALAEGCDLNHCATQPYRIDAHECPSSSLPCSLPPSPLFPHLFLSSLLLFLLRTVILGHSMPNKYCSN